MPTVTYSWVTIVEGFQVNEAFETGTQTLPAIAAINGGAAYFNSWDTGDGAIYGRLVENDGDRPTLDGLVNSTILNTQTDSSIAQLTGGNIIVTYTDYSVDAGGDILARILNSSGVPGSEIIINNGSEDTVDSDVAALADGGFVVTYTRDFGGGDLDTWSRIFNADGSPRTGVVTIDNLGSVSTSVSQVAGLTGGNYVVVYRLEAVGGGDDEVWFQIRNSATGAIVGSATLIDTAGTINDDIQVVALQDGGFAVAYTDNGWALDQTEITLRIFNSDGSTRSSFIRVNTSTTGAQNNPTITTLSNGYIVVGWNDGEFSVYQAYTPTGTAVGSNFDAHSQVVETEIAGLVGGLLANVRESTFADDSGNSIRSSIHELTRTTQGDGTSETLVGDSLRDTINGAAGNDIITGGINVDLLNGGAGFDTFRDSGGAFNGDIITDFGPGDRIHINDANQVAFSYSLSGTTLNYTGGSVTLTAPINGTVVATPVQGAGMQLTIRTGISYEGDFNGDGRSDVLWRNEAGALSQWLGQPGGGFAYNPNAAYALPTNWKIQGIGDFNGDGRDDIMWRNEVGAMSQWLGQLDGTYAYNPNAAYSLPTNWQVAAIGDFNGDNRDDIIWRNEVGALSQWLGQLGGTFAYNPNAAYQLGTEWSIIATGDFNGDNRDDILWRNTSGGLSEWLGQIDGTFAYNAAAAYTLGLDWQVAAMGDFNGDGRTDILWRNNVGAMSEWLGQIDGTFQYNGAAAYQLGTEWKIAGYGDFDFDGDDDLLWRDDAGNIMEWLAQPGGTFAWNPAVALNLPTNWSPQPADYWI